MALSRVMVPPWSAIEPHLHRASAISDEQTRTSVAQILAAVRANGDAAVHRFQEAFDGVTAAPPEWEVPRDEWQHAVRRINPELRSALERAAARVRVYHERQIEPGFIDLCADGTRLGYRVLPLERVGVYVPGGQAAYPSSVLMSVIPAAVAGVREIVVATPVRSEKRARGSEKREALQPGDAVLAACAIAGATRLFCVGGAQAIGAMAYGTETIPRVDKIVGPGNRWVAEAKRQVVGQVGIDMIAGPTEILIVADDSADPDFVAADLIAQAEHDADASAWLVTTSQPLVEAVEEALARRLVAAPRGDIVLESLRRNGLAVIVTDLDTAIALANRRAPEHLELMVREAEAVSERITSAGAVFVGADTPEPVGDYIAGPSHVLPTGGTARFASPLGVYDFVKRMSVIAYSPARLAADSSAIQQMAEAEGLAGHAEAVRARMQAPSARTSPPDPLSADAERGNGGERPKRGEA